MVVARHVKAADMPATSHGRANFAKPGASRHFLVVRPASAATRVSSRPTIACFVLRAFLANTQWTASVEAVHLDDMLRLLRSTSVGFSDQRRLLFTNKP